MILGYARVSTPEQNPQLQQDALKEAGCDQIFTDVASGSRTERPELDKVFSYMRPGDTFMVWRLDRLGRSMKHLLETMKLFDDRQIIFKSLQQNIDTSTPGGKLIFHVFCALAEFELELVKERTKAGLKVARDRGRIGGRPHSLTKTQILRLIELYDSKVNSIAEIGRAFAISKTSIFNYVKEFRGNA